MSRGEHGGNKPEPPRQPEPWECCQSGSDPCVYNRYWKELARYERALEAWRARHRPHADGPSD